MTHHGNIRNINGAEVEPVDVVTRYHFKEAHNGK